jgi:spermidine synthase
LVGALAVLAGRAQQALPADEGATPDGTTEPDARELRKLAVLAFASGWLVFACEVVFTHLLALVIGNSAYAFGVILAVFLICLFFGAARAPWLVARFGPGALPLGLAAAGLALASTLPLWDELPYFFIGTGKTITSFAGREAVRAVAAFAILVVPTTLAGLTFPSLLARLAPSANVGRHVGRLTAINTLGAVAGSLVTGYVVLPRLGSQHSIVLFAAAFALLAPWAAPRGGRARAAATAGAVATLGLALLVPRWDLARLTSGASVYFDGYDPPERILMLREDVHGGVTSVAERGQVRFLYTNGKFQGNDGWEMPAQRLFAHYPSLFVERFDRVLVIGLGTGTTLGALTAYPWKRIDVVEISPSIVEAAATYFSGPNRRSLEDPRVRLRHGDGRNHVLVTDARYDLISMELSSVWFAGAASLYSREFYAEVHEKLVPGGVLQQWVQLHHIERRPFATILQTLRERFPHVALFYGGRQGILVASEAPLRLAADRIRELQARRGVRETLPWQRPLESLLDDVLLTGAGLERFLLDSAQESGVAWADLVSSDDNVYLEYATPRGNVLPWSSLDDLVAVLRGYRDAASIRALGALQPAK